LPPLWLSVPRLEPTGALFRLCAEH
jgi:hypothetical protein